MRKEQEISSRYDFPLGQFIQHVQLSCLISSLFYFYTPYLCKNTRETVAGAQIEIIPSTIRAAHPIEEEDDDDDDGRGGGYNAEWKMKFGFLERPIIFVNYDPVHCAEHKHNNNSYLSPASTFHEFLLLPRGELRRICYIKSQLDCQVIVIAGVRRAHQIFSK